MSETGDSGFLTRWSRRKIDARKPDAEAEAVHDLPAPAENGEPDVDLSILPPIDSITASTDITQFLKKGVPDSLRQAALSQMWRQDDAIRNYIGPSEMSWDFNAAGAIYGHGPLEAADLPKMLADIADHAFLQPAAADAAVEEPHPATDAEADLRKIPDLPVAGPADELSDASSAAETGHARRRHGTATPK